jgi:undecaprenyl-diphosphatase
MDILSVDQDVLYWLNNTFLGKSTFIDSIFVFLGVYFIYALPVIMIYLWFKYPARRVPLTLAFFACIFSWFVITKSIVPNFIWFRERPDLGLIGLKEVFFHRPDYSFPSDHATALFALTFGFYAYGWKKVGNWFLVYTILILVARVTIGIHFPLDIVGGMISALLGVGAVYLAKDWLAKNLIKPIEKILKKIKLA